MEMHQHHYTTFCFMNIFLCFQSCDVDVLGQKVDFGKRVLLLVSGAGTSHLTKLLITFLPFFVDELLLDYWLNLIYSLRDKHMSMDMTGQEIHPFRFNPNYYVVIEQLHRKIKLVINKSFFILPVLFNAKRVRWRAADDVKRMNL